MAGERKLYDVTFIDARNGGTNCRILEADNMTDVASSVEAEGYEILSIVIREDKKVTSASDFSRFVKPMSLDG